MILVLVPLLHLIQICLLDNLVSLKIAKNITKPVIVNENNKGFLTKLVRVGPDHPGAKILERKNGENTHYIC